VLEAGAGTGILSLFAAAAGAAHVVAIEIDGLLAAALRRTVALNGFADVIEVVSGDAATCGLLRRADVFIGELLETALLDEEQVRVVNALHRAGVIDSGTRLIPERYDSYAELVAVDATFYGFHIAAPLHEWPNYATETGRWHETTVAPLSAPVPIAAVDFRAPVDPLIDRELVFTGEMDSLANAVRLSGIAHLTEARSIGRTNALNGDKIVLLPEPIPVECDREVSLRLRYEMGGGLRTLRMDAHSATR
jgi:predicted RNA methylase